MESQMSVEVELFDRLRKVEMQIGTHEAVCAERYRGILQAGEDTKLAVASMNRLAVKVGLLLIVGMASILDKLVFFAHGG
jgi:hypothetical protein